MQKTFGDYTVTLDAANLTAEQLARLRYFIEKGGQPVEDLKAYLGAPMHIAVARSDFEEFIHTHGELPKPIWERLFARNEEGHVHTALPATFGPDIEGYLVFATLGEYHIFGEFKHEDRVISTHFMVHVE